MCGQNQKIIFYASIYYHFRDNYGWRPKNFANTPNHPSSKKIKYKKGKKIQILYRNYKKMLVFLRMQLKNRQIYVISIISQ